MASSSGWAAPNWGFGRFGHSSRHPPENKHVRRCEPGGKSDTPSYDPKQAYATAYLQAGLGHAAVAFAGDVIAQRVEGRWGTKIRDPSPQERKILKILFGGELAEKWAARRERGVAERRKKRREEKERITLEEGGCHDDAVTVKPPLADVSERGGVSTSGREDGGQFSRGGGRKSEGVLSFVHTAFKGFLNLRGNPNEDSGGCASDKARVSSPLQIQRRRPCHDPDDPPGYSLLRSLRMASFAFFVDHTMTNIWTQSIGFDPLKEKMETTAVKLAITEAVLTPARIALLFTWDSLLQRKPGRIVRKLRTDFRPAVVRSLQVAAFENVAFYGLTKELGWGEEAVFALVGLPVSLYYNYYQSTITAR